MWDQQMAGTGLRPEVCRGRGVHMCSQGCAYGSVFISIDVLVQGWICHGRQVWRCSSLNAWRMAWARFACAGVRGHRGVLKQNA